MYRNFLILTLILPQLLFAQPTIRAVFEPSAVALGETANYCIVIEGDTNAQPEGAVPSVAGLALRQNGTQVSTQMINGKVSASRTLRFAAQPAASGSYTVPAYTLTLNGKSVAVNAATLVVGEGILPMRFVALTPAKTVYVGQTIPVEVKFLFLSKVGLRNISPLVQKGDAFSQSLTQQEQPQQTVDTFDGVSYNALIWPTTVTALKSGAQTLSFEMQAIVADNSRQNPFDDDLGMFPSLPAMQMLASGFSQRQISLQSEPLALEVLPLPAEGKPLDFTGAVGTFTLTEPEISEPVAVVGEALTVRLKIIGTGNFDRIGAPALALGSGWKVYPNTKKEFIPKTPAGNEGVLTFEYTVMPLTAGDAEIAPIGFNYFDPQARRYARLETKPLTLPVKAAALTAQVAPAPIPAASPAPAERPSADAAPALAPEKAAPTEAAAAPFYRSLWFWVSQAALLALLGALAYRLYFLRELQTHPELARKRACAKHLRDAASAAVAAAAAGDADAFFPQVQAALQFAAGRESEHPRALAWEELRAAMLRRGASPELLDTCEELWNLGDSVRYGGASSATVLSDAAARLRKTLPQIDALF